MSDELMTPDDVCDLLKVTKDWLYDQVQARRIPYIRLGRHLRFRRTELQAYIDANSISEEVGTVSRAGAGHCNVSRAARRDAGASLDSDGHA